MARGKIVKGKIEIRVKRAYDKPSSEDGFRVLVDRLWPRGVSKERAKIDLWARELAPSDKLRRWFAHDPLKWEEFKARYAEELRANKAKVMEFVRILREKKKVTLVYSARDKERNNAVALASFLRKFA
ncbi:DUF488 family protein [Candidatus Pacearchaeota archaeon]|nr:MAG: DUF488 family protein [Candidatus Pacearchaeota archaeon]